ncbi:UDP-glucosyltransferase 2-like [Cylas formicarius]|uniref:UDP-glucosyltransferase 2-like n=1 Tax=Cylas formicarius TaxID=197179 RepID=UPI0029589075|nr:UDP-glucosyltransferase 2-like [Cylas formicarius]
MIFKLSLACAFFAICSVETARILGVFPSPGPSQYILAEALLVPLVERGHQVTVISAFETKTRPNLTNVKFEIKNQKLEGNIFDLQNLLHLQEMSIFRLIVGMYQVTSCISEMILSDPKVQDLIRSNQTFDLVVVEQFHAEGFSAFAEYFEAPLIGFASLGVNEWNAHVVGNPILPSYVPHSLTGYSERMNFYQRSRNTVAYAFDLLVKYFYSLPEHQRLVDKYFPKKIDIYETMYSPSLMLQNSHPVLTGATPLTNAIVEIGGYHVKSKRLPEDIERFLDSADHGAILISLGSNLKSSKLPPEVLKGMFEVIRKLKQRVLWKFEADEVPEAPDNLYVSKWLPQTDILAHPNVVGFVSHCGLLSTTEATYYGVPIIAVPFFLDQEGNAKRLVESGAAVYLPYKHLSESSLHAAVQEILTNKSYRQNAKLRSQLLRDRVVSPLDEAIYWVEYVLRHGNGRHLRNTVMELSWLQVYLLDVLGVCILALLLFIYAARYATFKLFSRAGSSVKGKKKKQ